MTVAEVGHARRGGQSRLKDAQRGLGAAAIALATALIAMELLLRLYHGKLFMIASQLPPPPNRVANPHAAYHSRLGWVPKPGNFEPSVRWRWSVNSAGLRNNGPAFSSTKRPLLTVGDSFTFGDEVLDDESWPAQLQRVLQVPVLNGGVFAYGVDQAALRAALLLEQFHPQVVLLAFISHDINRTELSYYNAWKPYFEFADGDLILRNVPVPTGPAPAPAFAALRAVLSYSFLSSAILRRVAGTWWRFGEIERKHRDGENVTVDLLARLDSIVRAHDANLVVIALGTNGRIGGNQRTPAVVERARQRGIQVLDLVPEVQQQLSGDSTNLFTPGGHYSPRLNAWVAARVANYLAQPH